MAMTHREANVKLQRIKNTHARDQAFMASSMRITGALSQMTIHHSAPLSAVTPKRAAAQGV